MTCSHRLIESADNLALSARTQLPNHLTYVIRQLPVCDLDLSKDVGQLILIPALKGLLRCFP